MNEADVRLIHHLTADPPLFAASAPPSSAKLSKSSALTARLTGPINYIGTLLLEHKHISPPDTLNGFPVCRTGPQLSLNNFPLSKDVSLSLSLARSLALVLLAAQCCTHRAGTGSPLESDLPPWWPYVGESILLYYFMIA